MVLKRVMAVRPRLCMVRDWDIVIIVQWAFTILWLVVESQRGGWQSGSVGYVSQMASWTLEAVSVRRAVGML